jgi:CsoR family transcriptional regulator, copper-sensing transcriptional repressor
MSEGRGTRGEGRRGVKLNRTLSDLAEVPPPHPHRRTSPVARCACGAQSAPHGRKATAVDPEIKDRNLKRLRRIEGQVRGLQKMIDEERYCADVLTQLSSVHEALRGVAREVMRNHLKHCASAAIRSGDETAEEMYDELMELMYTHAR